MARNEDGEFELMLGNKQLLSVFFLMVLLLCLCFVGGYLLGRSAAPVLTAVNETGPTTSAPIVSTPPPIVEPTPAPPVETAKVEPPPVRTAPQVSTEKAEPVKASPVKDAPVKTAPVKAPPPPTKTAPVTKVASGSQPAPGKVYLQISATDKDKAEVMVDLLRSKKLPGMAAAIAERPGLYRVLVGPLTDSAIDGMKAQLKAGGFPGDQAIKRVF
ncbi:MAG: SPOR domain-containing protein [Bryobacteraceae bacterium]